MMKQILLLAAAALLGVIADEVCIVLSVEEFNTFMVNQARNCSMGEGELSCAVDYGELPKSTDLEADCANSKIE